MIPSVETYDSHGVLFYHPPGWRPPTPFAILEIKRILFIGTHFLPVEIWRMRLITSDYGMYANFTWTLYETLLSTYRRVCFILTKHMQVARMKVQTYVPTLSTGHSQTKNHTNPLKKVSSSAPFVSSR